MKKSILFTLALCAFTMFAYADKKVTVDCGEQAQISATPVTGYHFIRWNDNNTDNPRTITPTADITYKAFFAINRYAIVFRNWDGTELQRDTLDHGTTVSFTKDTPTKTATAQYTFTFAGWNPTISTPATGDATYTAQFDTTVNKYTITFLNYNGDTLQSSDWDYGTTPTYSGATPTKPADAEKTYTFSGWNNVVSTVTGNATYTAQYNSTTNSYTITTAGENGTTTGDGTYLYGTTVTLTATPNDCYKFVQWNDGNRDSLRQIQVNENSHYIAFFAANCEEYANLPVVALYDWLLMLNVRKVHDQGYYFGEQHVTWYRITGTPDTLQGPFPQDDEPICQGYYLTIDRNLQNTGDYYAVVDVSSSPQGVLCTGLMRSEIIHFSGQRQAPRIRLNPTLSAPRQQLTLSGMDPTETTSIMVYDMVGKLIHSSSSQGNTQCFFSAASVPGCYQVVVRWDNEVETLRYIVQNH